MIPEDPTQLDQKVVKVMSTIKKLESNGDYNAVGDNGTSHGAYQWQPNNFQNAAKEHNLDPNDFSSANQNKVAYAQIKAYKDAGRTPEEIDALWNGAHKDKTTGMYVHNSTERQTKFRKAILGQTTQTKPLDTTQEQQKLQEPGLGQQLTQRGMDIGGAVQETLQGKINPVSGVLQTAGSVAGMLGDITTKGLELIPGVKQLENLLGQGIGALAKTDIGQAVGKSIGDFSKEHPELSKDIGAGFNIITAIPILKGLGAIKNVALDATSSALKGFAEKSMAKDLTETLSRTIGGKKVLAKGGNDYIKTLIDERAIPDIVGNKYTTQDAFGKLGQRISEIDNNIYQPLLDKASVSGKIQTSFVPLKTIEQNAIKLAQDELKDTGPIIKYFERLKIKYGEYPPINELNKAKRLVSKNISEAGFASPTYSTDEIVRKSLQTAVEDGGRALGIPNIDAINQEMARLIKAQKILKLIEGKPVKSGMIGGFVKNTATVGGEIAGNATGIPIAGALTGRSIGGTIGKKLTGGVEGILKRTGKDATRLSKEELAKKMGLLFGGVASQKMNR